MMMLSSQSFKPTLTLQELELFTVGSVIPKSSFGLVLKVRKWKVIMILNGRIVFKLDLLYQDPFHQNIKRSFNQKNLR